MANDVIQEARDRPGVRAECTILSSRSGGYSLYRPAESERGVEWQIEAPCEGAGVEGGRTSERCWV